MAVLLFLVVHRLFLLRPDLRPADLSLPNPTSIARVQAAAKAGNVVAQNALVFGYLRGKSDLPEDVTKAVYWLRKVADRDASELQRIQGRMRYQQGMRHYELDPTTRRAMDKEYLALTRKELAFESAFLGLIDVYLG